ncbi:MAG: hypothetical protein XD60_1618 [Acetothermia bacterium 64_32]|nr:MAG: hypothetical protein XD60_1618 [Acetothermia bacterium 64_32]HAF71407.1 hypothetical protein [Candidatus Acetothermia bacterium]
MNCRQARELIPWQAAGSLPGEERTALAAHLAGCPACRTEFAQAVRLVRELRGAFARLPEPKDEVWIRTLARARGIPLGSLDVGSFLLGLSIGLSVRGGKVPLTGELKIFGHRVPLFEIEGGAR